MKDSNPFPYGDGDVMTYCLFAPAEELTPEKFHLYKARALAQAKADDFSKDSNQSSGDQQPQEPAGNEH